MIGSQVWSGPLERLVDEVVGEADVRRRGLPLAQRGQRALLGAHLTEPGLLPTMVEDVSVLRPPQPGQTRCSSSGPVKQTPDSRPANFRSWSSSQVPWTSSTWYSRRKRSEPALATSRLPAPRAAQHVDQASPLIVFV